jgi:3-deoxy-D-manno-octulosonic acid kinase
VLRAGLLYRADIMTVRLPATESLARRLRAAPLSRSVWTHMGATLRRFHQAGACHADLNAMNILLDEAGGCHVIDWDKGRLIPPRPRWQAANMQRLRRSLRRLGERGPPPHFREDDWAALRAGYEARGRG